VRQVELAAEGLERATLERNDVRAVFHRGGAISFQLVKWEAGKVLGSSSNFGRLAFDPAAFERVELSLKPAER
jgi:hypothetical protein